jgi:hypothetical protein
LSTPPRRLASQCNRNGIADRSGQIRGISRLMRSLFDTHPTRQIAAGNGEILWVSGDGSFPIKNDV